MHYTVPSSCNGTAAGARRPWPKSETLYQYQAQALFALVTLVTRQRSSIDSLPFSRRGRRAHAAVEAAVVAAVANVRRLIQPKARHAKTGKLSTTRL